MRTSFLMGLIVTLCVLTGVGLAAADSSVTYPDTSSSLALNLGGGVIVFVAFDNPGDHDIVIHAVNSFANLTQVFLNTLPGFAFWLDFEGTNGPFLQYGVYNCTSPVGQTCTVGGTRRGTLFI